MEVLLFLLGFCVWFSSSYALILLFIIWLSGYFKLAKNFPINKEDCKQILHPASAKLGNAFFEKSILLGFYSEGIYLRLSKPFSFVLSQTLFIPWVEAEVVEEANNNELKIKISTLKIMLILSETQQINTRHFNDLNKLVETLQ